MWKPSFGRARPAADMLPAGLAPAEPQASLKDVAAAYGRFCREVVDVVAPLVPAVKPQAAFFEQLGPPGMAALAEVVAYARRHGLLVILDGKRNDIGSTAAAYAEGYLGQSSAWGADALTVSPYLGDDSLQPFVNVAVQRAAGIFVLVKTSNPGGRMFQDLIIDKGPGDAAGGAGVSPSDGPGLPSQLSTLNSRLSAQPLYRHVAAYVEALAAQTAGACGYGAVGAVVGATYPAQLAELRAAMPHTWFLVPGYGAQGGAAAERRRGLRRPRLRGDRQQLPRHHLCLQACVLRGAVWAVALARGRRGGDAGDD